MSGKGLTRKDSKKGRKRWPLVLAGSATAVLAVAVVAAGSIVPGADASARITADTQVLPVGVSLANCSGPTQLLSGAAAGADPEFSPSSSSTKSLLSAVALSNADGVLPGAVVNRLDATAAPLFTLSTAPQESPDAGGDSTASASASAPASLAPVTGVAKEKAAVVANKDVDGVSVLRALPLGGLNSRSAGAVVVSSSDGDLQGMAASTCQLPANDLWLSGASTTVGRTAVLTLANSTSSPATVSLEFFGAGGPLQAPGGKGLVVAPGASRSVVLSGLVPDQELVSVHVKSTGGAVSAVIQQSVLRGLTPGGVDFLAPAQSPATSQTIPGVRVQDPALAASISAQSGYADATTALQVTVPGATDAVVEVKAYGLAGQVALPNGGVFTARAGKVNELSLAGLAQGSYTLSVRADYAMTATVRLVNATKAGDAVDLAFAPSTRRLGDNHLLTLPASAASSLVFTAPAGSATVTLVPISATGVLGAAKTVELKPGITNVVDPAALLGADAAAVLVSAAGDPVFGTQLLGNTDSANIAVLPVASPPTESPSLKIVTGY
ncbi:hypothetical protein AOC05_02605 [Arthrobacter alpinus]|uniref:Large extracellular alpha-helical protein n=1 Tax=Arthrobacter alpinus TaxID=656366 RepID=A0A0M4REJ7_9MICC|nr:hypothetical protein AOC05_02605 [Arthrobacter alpinus]